MLRSLNRTTRKEDGIAPPSRHYHNEVMVHYLDAIYEHGVLRPLEPLPLMERQRVRLSVEEPLTAPGSEAATGGSKTTVNQRIDELRWLAENRHPMPVNGWRSTVTA